MKTYIRILSYKKKMTKHVSQTNDWLRQPVVGFRLLYKYQYIWKGKLKCPTLKRKVVNHLSEN